MEDEENHAELVRRAFDSHKGAMRLDVVGTVKEARDYLNRTTPALVIADLVLPDGKGTELLPFEEVGPRYPLVVITAHGDECMAVEAMKAGVLDYVPKSQAVFAEMPHLAERAIREWNHIKERERAEDTLKRTNRKLRQTVKKLRAANQKTQEQQKAVIEEERLKALLEMAGATAHELNQPLTTLLGNIELMNMHRDNPEKLNHRMRVAEEASERLSNIVRKIQNIRHYETRPYLSKSSIINLDQKTKILSVEASREAFEKIGFSLQGQNQIQLFHAKGLGEAKKLFDRNEFDLVLFGCSPPNGSGLEFLKKIKGEGSEVPVAQLNRQEDELAPSREVYPGSYYCISEEVVHNGSLLLTIIHTLERARLKREIKETKKTMYELATRDELTGLYNYKYFMDVLVREVSLARRYGSGLALCRIHLDHFKEIYDNHGQLAWDTILIQISNFLRECFRQADLTCRWGIEEFGVIFTHTGPENARNLCERFREMVAGRCFEHAHSPVHVSVSAGIANYDHGDDQSHLDLVVLAEKALYHAKETGGNRVVEWGPGMIWERPKLGNVLISEEYITDRELKDSLSEQGLKLGEVLVQGGRITKKQLGQACGRQKKAFGKLGEILRDLGHSTVEDIQWALGRMKRKLGEILREKGLLTDEELNRALALQSCEPWRIYEYGT